MYENVVFVKASLKLLLEIESDYVAQADLKPMIFLP